MNKSAHKLREELNYKYVDKIPILNDDYNTIEDYKNFYKKSIEMLNELVNEVNEMLVNSDKEVLKNELTNRQIGCIQRCINTFVEKTFDSKEKAFTHALYELTDFIYYPTTRFEYKELSVLEVEIIKMMGAYLIDKANEHIMIYNKDKYRGKYKLKKNFSTFSKIYYDLLVNDKTVGNGWTRKRFSYFKQGMYLYIKPEYRRKRYGTIFFHLLCKNLAERDVEVVICKVNVNNKTAIKFLDNVEHDYDIKSKILNKIIYLKTLIVE